MIASGWALAYRSFLPKKGEGHDYVVAEEGSKAERLGIWAMNFVRPSDWRNHKMRLECER
jgi:endonuclease YncB( thermonuclease family)